MGNKQSCNLESMGYTCNYMAYSIHRNQSDRIVIFCYKPEGRDTVVIHPLAQKDTLALPSIPAPQCPSSAVSSDEVLAGHMKKMRLPE